MIADVDCFNVIPVCCWVIMRSSAGVTTSVVSAPGSTRNKKRAKKEKKEKEKTEKRVSRRTSHSNDIIADFTRNVVSETE
jgi:hypothetical protein